MLVALLIATSVHAQPTSDVSGCAVAASPADATEHAGSPSDPDNIRPTKAVFVNGVLWLVAGGRLGGLDICGDDLTWEARADTAVDLATGPDRTLYALTFSGTPRTFHVLRLTRSNTWDEVGNGALQGDETPRGLAVAGRTVGVVTDRAVYTGAPATLMRYATAADSLTGSLQPSFALLPDGTIYWGQNFGEWGGGLIRWSGAQPGPIGHEDSTSSLNGDPVTAVLSDPTRPGCVIAAAGVRHWLESGRIVRVCGESDEILFEDAYPPLRAPGERQPPVDAGTQAIFGLSPASDGFWAAGGREALRFRWAGGDPDRFPLPELVERGGVWMSTQVPGVIVLATNVNWAASLSGPTALVVSIE